MAKTEFHQQYEIIKRNWLIEKWGCVARALASALGAPLTPDQVDYRLSQVDTHREAHRKLIQQSYNEELSPKELSRKYRRLARSNQREIMDLINYVQSQPDTPAARALRQEQMDIRSQIIGPREIRRKTKKGSQVILLTTRHAAHVKPDKNGVIMVSDGGKRKKLEYKKYPAIVLTPKKPRS